MAKIYYFVDYENVHEPGLEGMNTLPKDCEVHLFYSLNANKLNLDLLRFVKAKLEVHKVKPGKQSLDMQMVSYLGYCIGEAGREGKFILVSKDTDYANTVLFWREEGVEVRVQPAIQEEKNADGMERALHSVKVTRRGRRGGKKNTAVAAEAAPPAAEADAAEVKQPAEALPAETEAEVKREEIPAPAKTKQPEKQPQEAAPEAEESVKEEKPKATRRGRRGGRGRGKSENSEPVKETEAESAQPAVKNTTISDEPAKVTVTVHDVPMVTHAVPEVKAERSQTAARVQAALAERRTDASVTRRVVSIVQKHEGKKNSRQAIYLEIRKTFGQKMGVDLYNSVKGLLK